MLEEERKSMGIEEASWCIDIIVFCPYGKTPSTSSFGLTYIIMGN